MQTGMLYHFSGPGDFKTDFLSKTQHWFFFLIFFYNSIGPTIYRLISNKYVFTPHPADDGGYWWSYRCVMKYDYDAGLTIPTLLESEPSWLGRCEDGRSGPPRYLSTATWWAFMWPHSPTVLTATQNEPPPLLAFTTTLYRSPAQQTQPSSSLFGENVYLSVGWRTGYGQQQYTNVGVM